MQDTLHAVADLLKSLLQGGEEYTCGFSGEESDFVRFNKNRVRQAGTVTNRSVSIDLIRGRRHATGTLTLSGDRETDRARIGKLVTDLRARREQTAEDPHLLYATEVRSTERVLPDRLPDGAAAVADIQNSARGRDLVGIYAAGGIHSGFANSLGQRNWCSTFSYNFDWSFYHEADKAVKTAYAGFEWKPEEFRRKVDGAAEQMQALAHPARTIRPGRYRVYLAPAAVYDMLSLLGWGGFGLKAQRTKQSPLLRMAQDGARLHPSVSILENTGDGIAPNFQEQGFLRPDRVTLIGEGAHRDCLVSPRSAREYGVPANGASAQEAPESIDLAAGTLAEAEVLRRLDTGIHIGNVWYLNWSDRNACRTTGMTRFATFWVEHGRVQAPLNVMRFDETMYRMLGENLAGLTAEREMILDPHSYFARSTRSGRVPGALVDDFALTL